jgi:hypothetical protein
MCPSAPWNGLTRLQPTYNLLQMGSIFRPPQMAGLHCDTQTLNHTPVSPGLGELGVVAFVGVGLND